MLQLAGPAEVSILMVQPATIYLGLGMRRSLLLPEASVGARPERFGSGFG